MPCSMLGYPRLYLLLLGMDTQASSNVLDFVTFSSGGFQCWCTLTKTRAMTQGKPLKR